MVLAIDLGGTKLALAVFDQHGNILQKEITPLDKRTGREVGNLIITKAIDFISKQKKYSTVKGIGISVPGISYSTKGTVWAPNIPGWSNYPLLEEVKQISHDLPVVIESDRACYILGELWKGNAYGCHDAIFLSVGTGIGAGILVNDTILRGSNDIAGAIGWMALERPFDKKYELCGCFEYRASGDGIAKVAVEFLHDERTYDGELKSIAPEEMEAHHVFGAYENNDIIAIKVIDQCIEFWGMASANLVSLFNPEKIIFGGGVFGPASKFITRIKSEASKWAQPIGITQVSFETSKLGGDAGLYGAGYVALKTIE